MITLIPSWAEVVPEEVRSGTGVMDSATPMTVTSLGRVELYSDIAVSVRVMPNSVATFAPSLTGAACTIREVTEEVTVVVMATE
jgi:hypothetical protein